MQLKAAIAHIRSPHMHSSAFCWKKHVSLLLSKMTFHVDFRGEQLILRVHESSSNPSIDIGLSNQGQFPLTWFFVRQWVQGWVRSFRAGAREERPRASSMSSRTRLPLP